MAKQLIPEELQALIDQYLTDGVLTDKERAVILKKAEGMGLDRDEIDLYLDAEVQKIDQQTDVAVRKQKGKTCPYCGGSVPQLTDKCPHCGQNITPEASSELQEIFDNLEEALVDLKSGNDIEKSKATVERYARKAKMYYGCNPKVQKLLEEIETETINAEKKAKSLARKNTLVSILTYNKKLTACVVLAMLGLLVWVFWPTSLSDEEKALRFVEKGEPEKALAITGKGNFVFDADDPIFPMIEKAFLEQKKYDEAIGVWDRSGYYANDNYRILCECIDKMQGETSPQELKKFILKYMSLFDDKDQEKYKKKLFDYAGIE